MKTILYIIQKEFIQIFRNKMMIPIIFVMPLVQLIILVHAATMEMKNIDIAVVDMDLSESSRKLTNKFEASPFFNLTGTTFSLEEAQNAIISDKADMILVIPQNFEQNIVREKSGKLQLLVNSINGTVAGIGSAYAQSIIMDFNKNIAVDFLDTETMVAISQQKSVNIFYQYWYNPELNYKTYMVPGILVLLVTIIGMFLSSMNLVREKEIGTIEQINVTPIRKYQFIIGKLFPFWVIALFDLAFGLALGKLLFDIPFVGSIGLVFLVASVYLLVVLGFGLLLSTISDTQQQAMFISWFFLMIFVLMSGLFTATESMPKWAQNLNYINPIAYFIKIIRMILLKGSVLQDIIKDLLILAGYGITVLSLAIVRYRKTA
jgi:ABC-2 type transport system permease protein